MSILISFGMVSGVRPVPRGWKVTAPESMVSVSRSSPAASETSGSSDFQLFGQSTPRVCQFSHPCKKILVTEPHCSGERTNNNTVLYVYLTSLYQPVVHSVPPRDLFNIYNILESYTFESKTFQYSRCVYI